MTPVFQTIIDPENGDCERACVATILDLPIEDVPNFVEKDCVWWERDWIVARGYAIIEPKRETGPHDYVYTGLRNLAAIATVPSQKYPGGTHVIVVGWRPHPDHPEHALECFVVHDPNPGNKPYEDIDKQIIRLVWIVPQMLALLPEAKP